VTAWSPLRVRAFRALWLAVLASNLGHWVQLVGVQWLVVDGLGAQSLVALVHTATTLPTVVLAMPAGVLADVFNRRRLLVGVQLYVAAVAVVMTALAAIGTMDLGLLLALTLALGAGAALSAPAVGALIPDLVPREQLVEASALGAISINVARAVGPALGGLLIAHTGVAAVFALNVLAVLVFVGVLTLGRLGPRGAADEREQFTAALRAGGRYVRYTPVVRRILLRSLLFVAPATAIWALLPLLVKRELGMGAGGYGVMLAALGLGAILGAIVLPRLASALSTNWTIALASFGYAGALVALALVRVPLLLVVCAVPAGIAWVAVLANINAQMQTFLPAWVRARGLAAYQIVVFGGQAATAVGWALLAGLLSLRVVFLIAAAILALGVCTFLRWPLMDTRHINQNPAMYWPQPMLVATPEGAAGPIVVTVSYTVAPARQSAFIKAMAPVRQSRLRSGACRYHLLQDGERPRRYVETFVVPSWDEHLRQHFERLTAADEEAERAALALADGPPLIAHLIPPRPPGT
jgi:MFS family permease